MSPKIHIHENAESACKLVADEIEELIRARQANGKLAVLGLATGSTPIPLYRELVRRHQEDGLSFGNVVTFNLDEYWGLPKDHPESYWHFMQHHLFGQIDIDPSRVHLPSGMVGEGEIEGHCAAYEDAIRDAGGIDMQILGIGRTGHIGFNEPGSSIHSRTRRIHLDEITREDAAPAFGGIAHVPAHAITMGCGTILEARRIALMAWGENKAGMVKQAIEGPVDDRVSASFLQTHGAAAFHLDRAAASQLG
ncbi:MAG: glucosamine-6-phosphate deaminase [Luteolibacter sp.]